MNPDNNQLKGAKFSRNTIDGLLNKFGIVIEWESLKKKWKSRKVIKLQNSNFETILPLELCYFKAILNFVTLKLNITVQL